MINIIIVEKMAWVNFCKINNPIGGLKEFISEAHWNNVEIPPKLIIKVDKITFSGKLERAEISKHPLVISIIPPKKEDVAGENIDNKGDNEVITTKKIAIIAPTEITLKAESNTIDDKLFDLKFWKLWFSFPISFNFIFR